MDEAKKIIRKRLKERLPQCGEPRFIDVPDLFYGGSPVEKEGSAPSSREVDRFELPRRMAFSLLPNPTNAVVVGRTVLLPHPQNRAFERYLKKSYEKQGAKVDFIDTFDYAHLGYGNLHCVTNAIRYCQ